MHYFETNLKKNLWGGALPLPRPLPRLIVRFLGLTMAFR